MWTQKYEPVSTEDVVGNRDIVSRFQKMCETRYVQHMILCGPPGVGKSSLLKILTKSILGDQVNDATLSFCSADNKCNQIVREKIHQFVPLKISGGDRKFIIFKQAELLNEGVQQLMRRLMETHYHHAVFVFVCNTLGNLLESIQSRCHTFCFKPISPDDQLRRLNQIAAFEEFRTGAGAAARHASSCERIVHLSHGDMRFSVNYFQAICAISSPGGGGAGTDCGTDCNTTAAVADAVFFPHYDQIRSIFEILGDPDKSLVRFGTCLALLKQLRTKGYCGLDIVAFMSTHIMANETTVPQPLCVKFMKDITLCHTRMSRGVDSFVQLSALVATMYRH
jgi:replication factor C subunit 2/4